MFSSSNKKYWFDFGFFRQTNSSSKWGNLNQIKICTVQKTILMRWPICNLLNAREPYFIHHCSHWTNKSLQNRNHLLNLEYWKDRFNCGHGCTRKASSATPLLELRRRRRRQSICHSRTRTNNKPCNSLSLMPHLGLRLSNEPTFTDSSPS